MTSTCRTASTHEDVADDDYDRNGKLSDDERDEDADGLTNYDEATAADTSGYWAACYKNEKPYPIDVRGHAISIDPDTDGDGVRDGADDQDHDDVPNLMELQPQLDAALPGLRGPRRRAAARTPASRTRSRSHGRVNPYNPCLPYVDSRTCERHPPIENAVRAVRRRVRPTVLARLTQLRRREPRPAIRRASVVKW